MVKLLYKVIASSTKYLQKAKTSQIRGADTNLQTCKLHSFTSLRSLV